ncbi:serine/threonine-protein kinase [Candidatus Uabimicrobium sp. HlEnr_7]|uniref:serine/threonine-protein kinase n=1 Tax=Candidatus Uabimicrobium helgolandensis TaxID=3095367 RepID=UPI003556FAF6
MKGIDKKDQEAFAKFLVFDKKVITSDDIKTCFKVQKAMNDLGILSPIDKVITEKGYLDGTVVSDLIKEFKGGDEDFVPGYRIISKLGEGAMGEVYKAVDIEENKEIAIKVLFPHLGKRKSTAKRFLQEAEICKKLNHPNIVKGFDVGYEADQDFYFYIMEYVDGVTLSGYVKKNGILQEDLAIKIIEQMASALEQATRLNLVHRDIKPDNIILTKNKNAKLCDLGLARNWAQDLSLTLTGAVMGTPFYISPEAARGVEELDSRSDIYSLGATLYHLVIGEVPFKGKNSMEVLDLHKSSTKITSPKQQRGDLSHGLSAIIEKMMAKTVGDRYQNPSELLIDIELLKKGEEPFAIQEKKQQDKIPQQLNVQKTDTGIHIKKDDQYRQSSVQEYSIRPSKKIKNANKTPKLFDNFFTSAEQRVLSNAKWKLVGLISLISLVIFLIIILAVFLVMRVFF